MRGGGAKDFARCRAWKFGSEPSFIHRRRGKLGSESNSALGLSVQYERRADFDSDPKFHLRVFVNPSPLLNQLAQLLELRRTRHMEPLEQRHLGVHLMDAGVAHAVQSDVDAGGLA